ncbi:hypothetical protein [Agarilytica rhodophyticola]|uniref:hypothetical protein n=1 Tax=Agarilytica rhodophyticola TaxID=1737490 RepID=UPI000B3461C4|nr:hypothetical protein [Agarilytica rhodophyticola]
MKKLLFLALAALFSHNSFSEQNLGPVAKFPESSRVEFKDFTASSMQETFVQFSSDKTQGELDQIAEKYSLKVFSSNKKNQAVVAGYFSNILALAGNDDVILMEQGHFTHNSGSSRRYRIDYSGLGSPKQVSSFVENSYQVKVRQENESKLIIQDKYIGGDLKDIGEIRFINPIVSFRVGNACSFAISGERLQSRVVEATTVDSAGQLSYHYIYVRFAYALALNKLNNVPVIDNIESERSCIPQQTYTAAEIGLPPVSGL